VNDLPTIAARHESADLEFPDWGGLDDSTSRISHSAAFRLCEEYAAWFPEAARKWQAARPEMCPVEFIL
jgi:hypothetical protein